MKDFEDLISDLDCMGEFKHMYALVDSAQFYHQGLGSIPGFNNHKVFPLLDEDADIDALLAGPLLIPLSLGQSETFVCQLLTSFDYVNAVSFISSAVAADDLIKHLTYLANIKHYDDTEWVMRYFDPRILPFWFTVLTQEQKKAAVSPIHRWVYLDIKGQKSTIYGSAENLSEAPPVFTLSYEQYDYLMRASLPYTIASMLLEDNALCFEGMTHFERVQLLREMISQAEKLGISDLVDKKTFCIVAILSGPDFIHDKSVRSALEAAGSGGFTEQVSNWTNEVWLRISK